MFTMPSDLGLLLIVREIHADLMQLWVMTVYFHPGGHAFDSIFFNLYWLISTVLNCCLGCSGCAFIQPIMVLSLLGIEASTSLAAKLIFSWPWENLLLVHFLLFSAVTSSTKETRHSAHSAQSGSSLLETLRWVVGTLDIVGRKGARKIFAQFLFANPMWCCVRQFLPWKVSKPPSPSCDFARWGKGFGWVGSGHFLMCHRKTGWICDCRSIDCAVWLFIVGSRTSEHLQ